MTRNETGLYKCKISSVRCVAWRCETARGAGLPTLRPVTPVLLVKVRNTLMEFHFWSCLGSKGIIFLEYAKAVETTLGRPGLVDKYALAFAREGRLKEARMFCFGECWNTDL